MSGIRERHTRRRVTRRSRTKGWSDFRYSTRNDGCSKRHDDSFRLNSRSFNDARDSGFASSPSPTKIKKDGGGGVTTADGHTPGRKFSELNLGESGDARDRISTTRSSLYPSSNSLNILQQHSTLSLGYSNKVNTSDENKNKRTSAAAPAPTRDGNFQDSQRSTFYVLSRVFDRVM